jgi:hypothetical protein
MLTVAEVYVVGDDPEVAGVILGRLITRKRDGLPVGSPSASICRLIKVRLQDVLAVYECVENIDLDGVGVRN